MIRAVPRHFYYNGFDIGPGAGDTTSVYRDICSTRFKIYITKYYTGGFMNSVGRSKAKFYSYAIRFLDDLTNTELDAATSMDQNKFFPNVFDFDTISRPLWNAWSKTRRTEDDSV